MLVVPLTLVQANTLVRAWHRHHKPVQGHRFSIGAFDPGDGGKLVGAAITGRPVAPELDPYMTAEVTRLVTNGHKNACSFLYAAAARIAREMGFTLIQTYVLEDEPATTLVAAGWQRGENTSSGHTWNNRSGRRTDQPAGCKQRWYKILRVYVDTESGG